MSTPDRSIQLAFEGIHDESMAPAPLTLILSGEPDEFADFCGRVVTYTRAARIDGSAGEWREPWRGHLLTPNGDLHSPHQIRSALVVYADGHARVDVEVAMPNGATVRNVAWQGNFHTLKEKLGVEEELSFSPS